MYAALLCIFILMVDRCQVMFIIGTVHVYFVFGILVQPTEGNQLSG